jgi:hypothetical protein
VLNLFSLSRKCYRSHGYREISIYRRRNDEATSEVIGTSMVFHTPQKKKQKKSKKKRIKKGKEGENNDSNKLMLIENGWMDGCRYGGRDT